MWLAISQTRRRVYELLVVRVECLRMRDYDTIGRFGYVSAYDPEKHRARIEFPDIGIVSGWLPVGMRNSKDNRDEHALDVGEHVYCLLHENSGIVLCSVYDDENPPTTGSQEVRCVTYKDGTTMTYDRENHALTLEVQGDIQIHATGKIEVTSDGESTYTAGEHMGLSAGRIDLN